VKPHPLDTALMPVRGLMGVVIATLPRRVWNEWEGRVPVRASALPAALVPLLLAFAIGIPAFLEYALGMGSTVGSAVLEAGAQANMGKKPMEAGAYAWYGMIFALPAFLFATPLGWVCMYLGGSGLVRLLCWAADDPRGDPLIDLADAAVRGRLGEASRRRFQRERNALEGPLVADVLVTGRAIGVPEATYAVMASRVKPDWAPGVFVLTEDERFRIGEPFDRRFPDGLRVVYPLLPVPAAEATRRRVTYTLPPLSEWDAVERRPRGGAPRASSDLNS
jgi:hypothetical protein